MVAQSAINNQSGHTALGNSRSFHTYFNPLQKRVTIAGNYLKIKNAVTCISNMAESAAGVNWPQVLCIQMLSFKITFKIVN